MTITITLPETFQSRLQQEADAQHLSIEEVVIKLLSEVLEPEPSFPSPEEVVAKIQAMPPNPQNIRPARGSLADALRAAPENPEFDLKAWQQEWAAAEVEMKAMTRANGRAGRGAV